MAKKSSIEKNARRLRTVQRFAEERRRLREVLRDPAADDDAREAAWARLRRMPRDSNPNRLRLRCQFTGRPRGNYRKLGISRIMLRELALRGEIPGMRKSSW